MYSDFKKVLIVEPRTDVARLVREVAKEIGATEAVIVENVKEAWSYLQTADAIPDWIISFPDADEKYNILHLMQIALSSSEFENCRISIILNEEEKSILPIAFDLGLLSYHVKPFTKGKLKTDMETLVKDMSAERDEHHVVAADYLRAFLNEKEDYNNRIALERSLVAKFPKNTRHYLALAETLILASQEEEARKTLAIAKHLGANLGTTVKQLQDLLNPADDKPEITLAESFGITKVLVVDSDEASAKFVEQTLQGLGVKEIAMIHDGQTAADWLKENGEPSLMVSEWKLPKISGPALVQRIRQMGYISLPIIVLSALVKEKDKNLLKEIGVSAIVKKPVISEHLVSEIVNVFQNERIGQSAQNMERKIRQLLETKKTKEAEDLYEEFKKQPGVPEGMRLLVETNMKFYSGRYAEAKDLALAALKEKGEAVVTLNLLSKIFMKLNDKESALKCLNRAQEYSSDNLERLVLMAEAYADSGNVEQAEQAIATAKKVDATNEVVIQAEAELAISTGDSNDARKILSQMDSAMSLIANMNNRAVLMVNGGDADKGLTLYKNALESLPEEMFNEKDIISYNMSLAFARNNQNKEARESLVQLVTTSKNKPMVEKAKALLKRVEEAIASNKQVKLNLAQAKEPEVKSTFAKPIALHLKPGQLCLHGIFDAKELFTEQIYKIIQTPPQFSRLKIATMTREKAS